MVMINNIIANRTSCRPIQSEIILVINKSDTNHSYDYRLNFKIGRHISHITTIKLTYSSIIKAKLTTVKYWKQLDFNLMTIRSK